MRQGEDHRRPYCPGRHCCPQSGRQQCRAHGHLPPAVKYVLHLIPSGILRRGKTCVIGNGVVCRSGRARRPKSTVCANWESELIRTCFLAIALTLFLPYHRLLDEQRELRRGRIGTTKRGDRPGLWRQSSAHGAAHVRLDAADRVLEEISSEGYREQQNPSGAGRKAISFREVSKSYLAAVVKNCALS